VKNACSITNLEVMFMPKRSSKVAPKGASCARTSSNKSLRAHVIWYDQNQAQAKALSEKAKFGVDLAPKEKDFLSWWAGYSAANPDPKGPPKFSSSVIRRNKDPME
jgi:hypothetical protein